MTESRRVIKQSQTAIVIQHSSKSAYAIQGVARMSLYATLSVGYRLRHPSKNDYIFLFFQKKFIPLSLERKRINTNPSPENQGGGF